MDCQNNWTCPLVQSWLDELNSSSLANSTDSRLVRMTSADVSSLTFSSSLLISFTVSLGLLVTIGLLGNTVVIFALFRTGAHRATTTNAYILNLSIADLLFLLFCVPFQGTVYILNDWPYGDFMCKAAHFCQYWTMYASIWLLTVMSVDRYLAIGHPLKSVDWRSPGQAMRICCYVWLVSAALSIPWWILYRTETYPKSSGGLVTACFDFWSDAYEYRKWLFLLVFLTGFVLPSCVIFCMAILVARSIRNAVEQPLLTANQHGLSHRSGAAAATIRPTFSNFGHAGVVSKRRRRVVWLVFGLALTFFLCWLPQNASFMWLNFYKYIDSSFQRHYKIYFIIRLASHMFTYVNSSINPILYSLASGRFRSRLAHALFVRNAGSFDHRGTLSRLRTITGNRNCATNGNGAGVNGSKYVASVASTNIDTKQSRPLLCANKSYSRTEEDLLVHSSSPSMASSPNQLFAPPTPLSTFVQNQDPGRFRMRQFSCNLGGQLASTDKAASTKGQRAMTWTATMATLSQITGAARLDNHSLHADNKVEDKKHSDLDISVKRKRKRWFPLWIR